MKRYLSIKNAIISLLLTVMFLSWLIEGLHPVKVIVACVSVFLTVMCLLTSADAYYMNANKKSASDANP